MEQNEDLGITFILSFNIISYCTQILTNVSVSSE